MIKKVSAFIIFSIILFSCNSRGERYSNLQSLSLGFTDSIPQNILQKVQSYHSLGLEMKLIRFGSVMERDSALFNDSIDGTIVSITDAITLHANGLPVNIVMENDTAYHLITGIGSEIQSVEQLRGGNIAVDRNTVIEYITDRILQEAGISPDEVNKAGIKKTSLRLDLLQSGMVDAAVLSQPNATVAIERGNRSIFNTTGKNIAIAATVFTNTSLNQKTREIEIYLQGYEKPSLPAAKEIQHTINWLKEKKLIPGSFTGEQLIDTIKGITTKH